MARESHEGAVLKTGMITVTSGCTGKRDDSAASRARSRSSGVSLATQLGYEEAEGLG